MSHRLLPHRLLPHRLLSHRLTQALRVLGCSLSPHALSALLSSSIFFVVLSVMAGAMRTIAADFAIPEDHVVVGDLTISHAEERCDLMHEQTETIAVRGPGMRAAGADAAAPSAVGCPAASPPQRC